MTVSKQSQDLNLSFDGVYSITVSCKHLEKLLHLIIVNDVYFLKTLIKHQTILHRSM